MMLIWKTPAKIRLRWLQNPDTVNMKLAMLWTFRCLKTVFPPTMTARGNMTGSTRTVPTMDSFCGIRKTKLT